MSTYVMSDLHGCFSSFMRMLKQIDFHDSDRLILAGDLIDRGPENMKMLKWLETKPENVEIVMGNHDYAFVQYVDLLCDCAGEGMKTEEAYRLACNIAWNFDYYHTIKKLIRTYKLRACQFKPWADIIRNFPLKKELNINGKDFIIVHAGYLAPEQEKNIRFYGFETVEEFYLNARDIALYAGGRQDSTIIAGHTPTIVPDEAFYNHGKVFKYSKPQMNCDIYDIDCGYVFQKNSPEANMACIRLEDEAVFYLRT